MLKYLCNHSNVEFRKVYVPFPKFELEIIDYNLTFLTNNVINHKGN